MRSPRQIATVTPCALQVLAQLLECRSSLSAAYVSLFPPLLVPTMWERPGNIPALVRLICAYITKGKGEVTPHLDKVPGASHTPP